jgi:tetratricopeptide (TPR) repeat protein
MGESLFPKLDRLKPQTQVQLLTMVGVADYATGDFVTGWDHLNTAVRLDSEARCTTKDLIGGADPAIVSRSYATWPGMILGHVEQSLELADEARAIACTRGHAFSTAWAHLVLARVRHLAGHYREASLACEEAARICEQHDFQARLGTVMITRGAVSAALGDMECGIDEYRRGLELWRRLGGFHMPAFMTGYIELLLDAGRLPAAEAALVDAEEIVAKTEERSHVGELLRLRSRLQSDRGGLEEPLQCLARALQWSRERHAKVFELRAAYDLVRLQLKHALRTSVDELRTIVETFSPSLRAPDVDKARELLTCCSVER